MLVLASKDLFNCASCKADDDSPTFPRDAFQGFWTRYCRGSQETSKLISLTVDEPNRIVHNVHSTTFRDRQDFLLPPWSWVIDSMVHATIFLDDVNFLWGSYGRDYICTKGCRDMGPVVITLRIVDTKSVITAHLSQFGQQQFRHPLPLPSPKPIRLKFRA